MSDEPNDTPQMTAPEGRVRIVNTTGIGCDTKVVGLEHAKIRSVEVLPFGPDDLVTARIVIIEPELDLVAKDLDVADDPEPRLPALVPPVGASSYGDDEEIPVEAVTRLRFRKGDILAVVIPKEADALSPEDRDRVKQTFRELGIRAPIVILEGGLTLQIINQRDVPLPPDIAAPGVSP